ncbi:Qat anti-phage system QueC-like protein QatC [Actinomadura coerulea]|uniref:Qat anti-phage system QueC-like protein QatC n=1 Tax=Actinomadura coerulea TaxID=46159 RepID=UPI0034453F05
MTHYSVTTHPSQSVPEGSTPLAWRPGRPTATIQASLDFFRGWSPTRPAAELLLLGASAYCVDRITLRREFPDAWTRNLDLSLPVADPEVWPTQIADATLDFLTGDRWTIQPVQHQHDPRKFHADPDIAKRPDADLVCLFSGGLDSLCGAIDALERRPERRVCLVSHYEGGKTSTTQQYLYQRLREAYGDRVCWRRLFLRPAPPRGAQAVPLPRRRETTTRSRSLLFLSSALALASALGPDVPVILPENGYIALNVPLTRARAGSLSTRTTHPHYLSLFGQLASSVGATNPVINPYTFQTKGQMLTQSANPDLLRELAPHSLSCSHPEAARFRKRPQGNCGYCFPCLIRRAAMAAAGWDSSDGYAWDALIDPTLLDYRQGQSGADLRAVLLGTHPGRPDSDLIRNGPIPSEKRGEYLAVWRRGTQEIRAWLQTGAAGLTARLESESQ